jgi:hypothetical protein
LRRPRRGGQQSDSDLWESPAYNGPNAWMPLLQNGELEMGIINILDRYGSHRNGNYKKPIPVCA